MSTVQRSSTPEHAPDPGGGLVQFVNLLFSHAASVLIAAALVGGVVAVVTFLAPRTYTSSVSFTPQQPSQANSSVAGLAAQFGMSLGSVQPSESPMFYTELLASRELLRRVASRTYAVPTDEGVVEAALADLYELDYPTEDRRFHEAIKLLGEITRVTPTARTGIVDIDVSTRWPALSQQVAAAYLEEVNRFNLQSRQSQAQAERRFAEGRLEESRRELVEAEQALERFHENNRRYQGSPMLILEEARLQRQVQMLQQVVTSLYSGYEQARVDEVRNTPLISVIDVPREPVVADARGTIRRTLLAGAVAGLLALLFGIAKDRLVQSRRSGDPDVVELVGRLQSLRPGRADEG